MGRYFLMFFVLLSSAVFAQEESRQEVSFEQTAVEASEERVVEAERQEEKDAELAACPRRRRGVEASDLLACGNCKPKKIA